MENQRIGKSRTYFCKICNEIFNNITFGFIGSHIQSHKLKDKNYKEKLSTQLSVARSKRNLEFSTKTFIKWTCLICNKIFHDVTFNVIGSHSATHAVKNISSHLSVARSKIKKRSNGYIKAKEEGRNWISPNINKQTNIGRHHTEESKEKIRQAMLKSSHRRMSRATRSYTMKDGSIIKLDSSWEEILAKRLDELNIKWIRPVDPIRWFDSKNIGHNYFPDFYLKEYDLYLDPKNPYALRLQYDKILIITKMLSNLVIIKTEEECRNFLPLRYHCATGPC